MTAIMKEILESLRATPGQWNVVEYDVCVEARHPSGIHINLYSFGCDRSSTIALADGGSLAIGFWEKRRLWKALRTAVRSGLATKAEARLGAHKYCPFCGREMDSPKEKNA